MKIIESQNYSEKYPSPSQFYLVVSPNGAGGWQVAHNIWPSTEKGGGQVLKSDFLSREDAMSWAQEKSTGEKVVVDDISNKQRYNEFVGSV